MSGSLCVALWLRCSVQYSKAKLLTRSCLHKFRLWRGWSWLCLGLKCNLPIRTNLPCVRAGVLKGWCHGIDVFSLGSNIDS